MTIRDRIFHLALAFNECLVTARRSRHEIARGYF